jgi:hypothetical protein
MILQMHCTALHCTALHCTALHCTALHCTALHCTALVGRAASRRVASRSTELGALAALAADGPHGCWLLWTRAGLTRALFYCSPVLVGVSFTAPCRAHLARWSPARARPRISTLQARPNGCWLLWTSLYASELRFVP